MVKVLALDNDNTLEFGNTEDAEAWVNGQTNPRRFIILVFDD